MSDNPGWPKGDRKADRLLAGFEFFMAFLALCITAVMTILSDDPLPYRIFFGIVGVIGASLLVGLGIIIKD